MRKLLIIFFVFVYFSTFGQSKTDTLWLKDGKGFISEFRYSATKDTLYFNGDIIIIGSGTLAYEDSIRIANAITWLDGRIVTDSTRLINVNSALGTRIADDSTKLVDINSALSTRISNDSINLVSAITRIVNDSSRLNTVETSLANDSTALISVYSALSDRITNDSTDLKNNYTNITKLTDSLNLMRANFAASYATDSLRTSGADTLFLATHRHAVTTLTGNATVFLSGLVKGYEGQIRIIQGGSGGYSFTITNMPQKPPYGKSTYVFTGLTDRTVISWWYDGIDLYIVYGRF